MGNKNGNGNGSRLTEKQRRFALEYILDLNATQAAIRAGYSEQTARSIGYENLTKPHIQEAIQSALEARQRRTAITADRVLEEIAKIAFTNLPGIIDHRGGRLTLEDFDNLTPEQKAAISEVSQMKDGSLRIKTHSKPQALQMLTKHLGIDGVQKVEHSGRIDGNQERKVTIEFVRPKNGRIDSGDEQEATNGTD